MFAELIVTASRPRPADPSGLCLSQAHSSFSNNGSPSACHEQLCSCKCEFVFICTSDLLRSVAVETQLRLPLDRTSASEEPLPSPGLSGRLLLGIVSQPQCTRAFTVYLACKSSSGHLVAHLNHRYLSFDTLELWEPDAAPSWEQWQSHQSSRSVTTFKSSCASDSHVLAFHHNGHLHDLIHEQCL